jgi:hypothetical protein
MLNSFGPVGINREISLSDETENGIISFIKYNFAVSTF